MEKLSIQYMSKYNSRYILALLFLLILGGCRSEHGLRESNEVTLNLNIEKSDTELLLRAANQLRNQTIALEEQRIESLYYLLFSSNGNIIGNAIRIDRSSDLVKEGDTYRYPITLTGGQTYKIAVVANYDISSIDIRTIDDLKKHLISTGGALPATPIMMYAETTVENVQAHTTIKALLEKSLCAVDITSTAPTTGNNAFELEDEWYLMNGATNGYLSQDQPTNVADYTAQLNDSEKLTKDQRAYTFPRHLESINGTETYIIFKGRYHGVSSYYRVPLNVVNGKQELKHNKLYRLNIVKVAGFGYATLQEAISGKADKSVVFTVADWDDTESSETLFFGDYYISAEQLYFEFDAIQQQRSTAIHTNAPSLTLIPPIDADKAWDANAPKYEEANWTTVTLNPNGWDKTLYHLNVGCFQNNDNKRRQAVAYIRAEGIHTDDLKLRIFIVQREDKNFYSEALQMSVAPALFFSDSQKEEIFNAHISLPIPRQSWSIGDVQYYIPGKGYISARARNADGTPVITAQEQTEYGFIQSVSGPAGEWSFTPPATGTDNGVVTSVGEGDMVIKTKIMAERKPRTARVLVFTGGLNIYMTWVYVSQDFTSDYTITYPGDYPEDIKRSKYVMETYWYRNTPSEFQIDIKSNSSWTIYTDPKGAADWIKVEPSHFRYESDGQGGNEGYGRNTITTSVKVTVRPNLPIPHKDNTGNYVYPKARKGGISIVFHGNQLDDFGNPILQTNEEDIDIYQGGYVTIDGIDWLDRNLKTGYRFSEEYSTNSWYKGFPMLYTYANPIGLPTNAYGAYSKSNDYFPSINSNDYGDDGLFPTAGPQSGYGGTDGNEMTYYRHNERRTTFYHSFYNENNGIKWDELFGIVNYRERFPLNPCPPGWTIPSNANLRTLINAFANTFSSTYGKPNTFPQTLYPTITSYKGEMGVKNSGWMAYIEPADLGTGWYIPFFLPAAGTRLLNWNPSELSGTIGYYKQNEKEPVSGGQRQGQEHLLITPDKLQIGDLNSSNAASVRCIRKK